MPDPDELVDLSQEQPMPKEALERPAMKAKIEAARKRAREGGDPGSTAEDLLEEASERRHVDSRG
jgi:hypothetical protein